MAQTKKRPARANGSGPSHSKAQLPSYSDKDTAADPRRQDPFASWIARRVPVSIAAARVYAELHGIGGAL